MINQKGGATSKCSFHEEEEISIQDLTKTIQTILQQHNTTFNSGSSSNDKKSNNNNNTTTILGGGDEVIIDQYPFRGIYLYGSSVYENKVFKKRMNQISSYFLNGANDFNDNKNRSDLDILLVMDGFHHHVDSNKNENESSTLQDLEGNDKMDERNVYFEQDVTLHFKMKGSKGNWFDIESHIMSTSMFMEMIRQHKGITCQYVFMDRNEFVLYEDELMRWFRCFWFRNFHFHRRLFRRMIVREADVWCYSKARRLMTIEKDFEKGKKNLIHGIRYYRLAGQILENLTIDDYTIANELKKQVMSLQSTSDWSYWEGIFEPIYQLERDEFNKKVDKHIQEGLRVALECSSEKGGEKSSKLFKIIEDYGLQYLSLNYSTDVIPLAIFNEKGEELNMIEYLTCGKLIKTLLLKLMNSANGYCSDILTQLSNMESSNAEIGGHSVLFKITQLEEMERMEESIPRQSLRETNGIIISAKISDSFQVEYSVVAMPIPKVYDEFRWLNSNTKNKTQSNALQISDIEEITGIFKNYRGDTYMLYNYCGNWRWSHPNEDSVYFTKLSNIRNSNCNIDDNQFWNLLSYGEKTNLEEWNCRLSKHISKNFIFVKPRSENYLSLIAVRDSDTIDLDVGKFSIELFNCKYSPIENVDNLKKESIELADNLLYKIPYKSSSNKEKNIVLLLKYLYHRANTLDFIYDGFIVNMKLKSGKEYSVVCQSQFYYNMNQLTIWHTSINIDNVEDGKFNRFHGNILSQSNEILLIEMALTWLEHSWDEQVLESERKAFPKIIPFSDIYFSIKKDWMQICKLYDDFCKLLKEKIDSNSIPQKEVTKFISQNCEDFDLENKTIIYKIAEGNFERRAIEVFNSSKKTIDSNSLVKIWKDFKKKISTQ